MYEDLVDAIRRRGAILFVGAGVSKNVGVPTTTEIVTEIARQLDYDPQVFRSLAVLSLILGPKGGNLQCRAAGSHVYRQGEKLVP